MATEKKINSRIQQKHDVAANWAKATNFIPKKGEIIIYDAEYNASGEETQPVRFKIGDGSKTVNNLPFAVIDHSSDIEALQENTVPKTRKINNKALSSDITLGAADVGVTETAFPGLKKTGTVTGVKMNGTTKNPSSGVVDLGTVLTDESKFATAAQGTKADNALTKANANATEISNIKNGTTKVKSAEHADTAGSATSAGTATKATEAMNVTENIKGHAIADIFESNGTTVKKATSAGTADKVANGLTLGGGVVYDGSKALSIMAGNKMSITGGPGGVSIGLTHSVMPSTYNKVTVDGYGTVTAGENVDYLTSQSIKKLNTNNTAAQDANESEAIAGSGTINLHKVAKTGSYNDLLYKPTIPAAANNGTLTIQKNGTDVATFTANQSTNATANITVPTKVSELTNDSGYTTNKGTVTQVKINGTTKSPNSAGLVDLGTVGGGQTLTATTVDLTTLSNGTYSWELTNNTKYTLSGIGNNNSQKFSFYATVTNAGGAYKKYIATLKVYKYTLSSIPYGAYELSYEQDNHISGKRKITYLYDVGKITEYTDYHIGGNESEAIYVLSETSIAANIKVTILPDATTEGETTNVTVSIGGVSSTNIKNITKSSVYFPMSLVFDKPSEGGLLISETALDGKFDSFGNSDDSAIYDDEICVLTRFTSTRSSLGVFYKLNGTIVEPISYQ